MAEKSLCENSHFRSSGAKSSCENSRLRTSAAKILIKDLHVRILVFGPLQQRSSCENSRLRTSAAKILMSEFSSPDLCSKDPHVRVLVSGPLQQRSSLNSSVLFQEYVERDQRVVSPSSKVVRSRLSSDINAWEDTAAEISNIQARHPMKIMAMIFGPNYRAKYIYFDKTKLESSKVLATKSKATLDH
ncbi:hypothetical protein PoB_006977800 [Plakobranchus ocellatus]|uniref:Uncharacterized protein n=1 Tax=Plakobranchus ocellatus TaxID=259542 RepID=A0AAV4DGD9_9GAST|nr:hypothetical protein PoB_006977800 [Plakobranchus ocellatus]